MTFDPNSIGIANGNYFGLPYEPEESDLVLIPVPWDVTTSYKPGTANGPQAMLDASLQIDLFDFHSENAWENKISSLTENETIVLLNEEFRPKAEEVIAHLSEGGDQEDPQITQLLSQINAAGERLNTYVYDTAIRWMGKGKIPAVVGGEHSVPLGLIQALVEKYPGMGILHIDAHADLRKAYEGFTYSHASIMYNALQLNEVSRLVQVGIRDVCQDEIDVVRSSQGRVVLFHDYLLSDKKFNGQPWAATCEEIIQFLPQKVYISFDIDGLSPEFCPNTGTPVPGGMNFQEVVYLIKTLVESGRSIVGFDLCEVAPGRDDEWDANVGARILQKLCNFCLLSKT